MLLIRSAANKTPAYVILYKDEGKKNISIFRRNKCLHYQLFKMNGGKF